MPSSPTISVILPVHNGGSYLQAAITSILSQTCADFEFIIVNDASTDQSRQTILSNTDPRIRYLENETCAGISTALNRGLDTAQGRYVARMDADDISHPKRLETQLRFLDENPHIALCGTWVNIFGHSPPPKVFKRPTHYDDIQAALLFENPLVHPTVMFNRPLFMNHNLRYQQAFNGAEDYDLWARALHLFPGVNLRAVLLDYRQHPTSITTRLHGTMKTHTQRVMLRELGRLGLSPDDTQMALHTAISQDACPARTQAMDHLKQVEQWLSTLMSANSATLAVPAHALRDYTGQLWLRCCLTVTRTGTPCIREFWRSPLHAPTRFSNTAIMLAATVQATARGMKK